MSEFQYMRGDLGGQQVDGVLSAGSEQEALAMLAGRSLFPLHLVLAPRQRPSGGNGATRAAEAPGDCLQPIGHLLAGVPLLRSLELLEHKAPIRGLRNVLEAVRGDMAEGNTLADADAKASEGFFRAGRQHGAGRRRGSVRRGRAQADRGLHRPPGNAQEQVTGAMVYPIFLMVMGTVVVIAM